VHLLRRSADHKFLRQGRFSLTGEGVGRTMPMSESGALDVASDAAPRRRWAVCETPQTGEFRTFPRKRNGPRRRLWPHRTVL